MEPANEGAIQSMRFNRLDQLDRGTGEERQLHVGEFFAVLGQDLGQANGGGGFHRSQPQQAGRAAGVHQGAATLFGELQDTSRITEEGFARRRQYDSGFLADEQLAIELRFQLLHPHGDIGLHGVHVDRGGGEAAKLGHRAENLQLAHFHDHCHLS
ncbi:hypothetical protein D3C86_1609590 [compost metagenome]